MPTFTQNGHFAIDNDKLYKRQTHAAVVRNHAPVPLDVQQFTPPNAAQDNYVRLISSTKYFRDCLVTAEDLINNVYPNSVAGTDGIRSKTVDTREDFGGSHGANIRIARWLRTNRPNLVDTNANPAVGQAYATVALYPTATYPYHAAGVIAADGDSRVTLEVFASGQDATSRTVDGTYHIYSVVAGSGETFHDTWSGLPLFLGTRGRELPVTLVIEHR